MPFLSLPARPAKAYWKGWLVYVLLVLFLLSLIISLFLPGVGATRLLIVVALFAIGLFFYKHPYLFYLLVLAVPVKLSLLLNRFHPAKSFQEIHADVIR